MDVENLENFFELAVPIVIGIGFILYGLQHKSFNLTIKGLPTSKARSVAMGIAELSGKALPYVHNLDPIFKRPCAYYNIEIQDYDSSEDGYWRTIHSENSNAFPFFIEDETGQILIFPKNAEFHYKPQELAYSKKGRKIKNPTILNYVNKNTSKSSESFFSVEARRVIAIILRPNEKLYVLGHAQPLKESGSSSEDEDIRNASRLLKQDRELLNKLDLNKDGIISPQEWDKD